MPACNASHSHAHASRLLPHQGRSTLVAVHASRLVRSFAVVLFFPLKSQAQAHHWVVVAATTNADHVPRALDVGEHAAAALAVSGEALVPSDQAESRIETQLSQPFRVAPPEL